MGKENQSFKQVIQSYLEQRGKEGFPLCHLFCEAK